MDVSNTPCPWDRMSGKGEHLEHHFRWGLSELGIVVVVMMGSSTLGNGGPFYHFSC